MPNKTLENIEVTLVVDKRLYSRGFPMDRVSDYQLNMYASNSREQNSRIYSYVQYDKTILKTKEWSQQTKEFAQCQLHEIKVLVLKKYWNLKSVGIFATITIFYRSFLQRLAA